MLQFQGVFPHMHGDVPQVERGRHLEHQIENLDKPFFYLQLSKSLPNLYLLLSSSILRLFWTLFGP